MVRATAVSAEFSWAYVTVAGIQLHGFGVLSETLRLSTFNFQLFLTTSSLRLCVSVVNLQLSTFNSQLSTFTNYIQECVNHG